MRTEVRHYAEDGSANRYHLPLKLRLEPPAFLTRAIPLDMGRSIEKGMYMFMKAYTSAHAAARLELHTQLSFSRRGSRRGLMFGSWLALLGAGAACAPTTSTKSPEEATEVPEPAPTVSDDAEASPKEPETEEPSVVILADVGFQTPESVYFDRRRDVYLVSNINGGPTDADQNGFISRLTPQSDGTYRIDLKFIDGSKKDSPLHAPKGLTVVGDTLYVADIDRIRKFNAITGTSKGDIPLAGATFVNDVATGEDGVVYASDSGLNEKFESTGTDAIYKIATDGKVEKLASGPDLGSPNGLLASEGGVWTTTFRSGELYWVSDDGKRSAVQKLPQGQNDGLVYDQDGHLLISSWEAGAVLLGPPEGTFQTAVSGVPSPADIGYDCVRDILLIPLFMENKVVNQAVRVTLITRTTWLALRLIVSAPLTE